MRVTGFKPFSNLIAIRKLQTYLIKAGAVFSYYFSNLGLLITSTGKQYYRFYELQSKFIEWIMFFILTN